MPLLPLWAFVACSRVNFTFTFTLGDLPPRVTQETKIKFVFDELPL